MTSQLFESASLEEALAEVRDTVGPHAKIVRAEKVRRGGIAGFFAKESFVLSVEQDDSMTDATAPVGATGSPASYQQVAADEQAAYGHAAYGQPGYGVNGDVPAAYTLDALADFADSADDVAAFSIPRVSTETPLFGQVLQAVSTATELDRELPAGPRWDGPLLDLDALKAEPVADPTAPETVGDVEDVFEQWARTAATTAHLTVTPQASAPAAHDVLPGATAPMLQRLMDHLSPTPAPGYQTTATLAPPTPAPATVAPATSGQQAQAWWTVLADVAADQAAVAQEPSLTVDLQSPPPAPVAPAIQQPDYPPLQDFRSLPTVGRMPEMRELPLRYLPEAELAEPVMAEPIIAEPIIAEPIIAEPIIAEPIFAGPITVEPLRVEPLRPARPEPLRVQPADVASGDRGLAAAMATIKAALGPALLPGSVIAVVGQPLDANTVAARVAVVAGADPFAIHFASEDAEALADSGLPTGRQVGSVDEAILRSRRWPSRPTPVVIVVDGRDARWARTVLDAIESTTVVALPTPTDDDASVRRWVGELGGVQALLIDDTCSSTPETLALYGIPALRSPWQLEGRLDGQLGGH